jgi:VWFA-related protein
MTAVATSRRPRAVLPLSLIVAVAATFVVTAATQQQPVFRSTVDLIAVDVQVVDSEGNPISQIGPQRFEVSINGQKRKVVSAEFVRDASAPTAKPSPSGAPAPRLKVDASAATGKGRTFILAIDTGSFEVGTERAAVDAARAFVSHLEPDDRVGLWVYPDGAQMAPTADRAPVRAKLDSVIGQKPILRSYYNLKLFEIVDITTQSTNPNSFLYQLRGPTLASALDPVLRVQQRECPGQNDCPIRIYSEGMTLAVELERQAQASLAGLRTLLAGLAEVPGRKSVILVSAGVLVSDRPEGRPDLGDMGTVMGQVAARANATVYTLHIDAAISPAAASQRGTGSPELSRDRALQGNWLNAFSAAAGGKLIYVPAGRPDFAFDRVLRETSAYYLLGVEPAEADRDGQPRELKIKVSGRGVEIRSRQWVVIPRKGL